MRSPDQIGITWEENQLLMQQLRDKAALENRRQHNIYEAGDLVVHDAHIGDEIYEFISLLEDIGMATVKSKHMTGGCSLRRLRHATPEEIEAGKRLEVS